MRTNKAYLLPLLYIIAVTIVASPVSAGAIIINHTCTDISEVPDEWVIEAKNNFKMSYGHTSHGSQIVTGMSLLKGDIGSLYWYDRDGTNGGLSLHDTTPSGDLGNPDRYTWETRTRTMLDNSNNDRNIVMWSWCGQADTTEQDMQIYLDLMSGLEADYPDVVFVYMTGHLVATGEDGRLHQRNEQIRAHCNANDCVLFDFADIESYDPNREVNYMVLRGNDDCTYDGDSGRENWANNWCDANPDECVSCTCAHSKCLNCQMKGEAFWWMMARVAGWEGSLQEPVPLICGDVTGDGNVTISDVVDVYLRIFDPAHGNWDTCVADIDGNDRISINDVVQIYLHVLNSSHPIPCECLP